jgi:predicted DNA-binding transcriptional regulator AlpA
MDYARVTRNDYLFERSIMSVKKVIGWFILALVFIPPVIIFCIKEPLVALITVGFMPILLLATKWVTEIPKVDMTSKEYIEKHTTYSDDDMEREIEEENEVFNVKELAQYLGMSTQYVYKHLGIHRGFPFVLNPRDMSYLFFREEIDQWVQENGQPKPRNRGKNVQQ